MLEALVPLTWVHLHSFLKDVSFPSIETVFRFCFIWSTETGSGLSEQGLQGASFINTVVGLFYFSLFLNLGSRAHGWDLQLCIPLFGLAWELWLLFDLVCFGLLIKHVLCFVGGATQSGAKPFTHPLYSFLFHRCAAGRSRARGAEKDTLERGGGKEISAIRWEEKIIQPQSHFHASFWERTFHRFAHS